MIGYKTIREIPKLLIAKLPNGKQWSEPKKIV